MFWIVFIVGYTTENIPSHSVACILSLLRVSLEEVLNFMQSNFSIFFFVENIF